MTHTKADTLMFRAVPERVSLVGHRQEGIWTPRD